MKSNKKNKEVAIVSTKENKELAINDPKKLIEGKFENLTPYQTDFVVNFVNSSSIEEAVKRTRKQYGLPPNSAATTQRREMELLMLDPHVKNAVKEYRKIRKEIADIHLEEANIDIIDKFKELATSDENIGKINQRINLAETYLEKAVKNDREQAIMQWNAHIANLISKRDKLEKTKRENLELILKTSGKGKVVNNVGRLNINLGNQTIKKGSETAETLETIEAEYKENNEIFDIEE